MMIKDTCTARKKGIMSSTPRRPLTSTGPSLNGDGGGGEGSPKSLFERRKKTFLNSNGNNHEDHDDLEECSKRRSKVKSRGGAAVLVPLLISRGISSVLNIGKRLWQSPNRRAELIQIIKSHRRIVFAILISIPFILRPSRLWKWRYHLFGKHNIHGGAYGRKFEYHVNEWVWHETQRKEQIRLQQLGIQLPDPVYETKFMPHLIQTHAALKELLIRRHARGKTLVDLEHAAAVAASNKICNRSTTHSGGRRRRQQGNSDGDGDCRRHRGIILPHVLFVPDLISWNPPRPGKVKSFQKLLFDPDEMKLLVSDTAPFLIDKWDALSSLLDQIQLFALCAIYHFGGVFVGNDVGLSSLQDNNIVTDMIYSSTGWFKQQATTFVADAISTPTTTSHGGGSFGIIVMDDNSTITTIAATPRHPLLYCALRNLQQMTLIEQDSIATSIIALSSSPSAIQKKTTTTGWTKLWGNICQQQQPQKQNSACCTNISSESFTSSEMKASNLLLAESKEGPTGAELLVLQQSQRSMIPQSSKNSASPVMVMIQQDLSGQIHGTGEYNDKKATDKVSLDSRLESQGLQPSWLCARCIRIPTYGTMEKCSRFCPKGYSDFICHAPDVPELVHVPLNIVVQGGGSGNGPLVSSSSSSSSNQYAIPRIIHQTWFEDIDLDTYPQLARLRNGWKNTGWQYRFYTDVTARKYIEDYFPSRFVEAFDVLMPGAYKADLFRYLVLLREGGVYADIDVLLETTLDTFITPMMSFFAPRDVIGEHANEPFCLWNGLLGASPGHPFIVQAVERVINLILNRADLYDMERDLCRDSINEPLEIWKVQAQTLLLLSGPCALGVSVNTVLGRPALQALEVGWIGLDELDYGIGRKDHGDALILVVDKFDIGSFRISDPERSFVVASTNLDNVEKYARIPSDLTEGERKRQKLRHTEVRVHYSNATKNVFVWGSSGVYSDQLVANERFKLNVRYEAG